LYFLFTDFANGRGTPSLFTAISGMAQGWLGIKSTINSLMGHPIMARSDSFFIRAAVSGNGTTYNENTVDLGAFVDALGKSVLRIHNIQARIIDADNLTTPSKDNTDYFAGFQLTTQTQTGLVSFTERALIAAGVLATGSAQDAAGGQAMRSSTMSNDLMPQDFENGFLVAVDTLFLGVDQNIAATSGEISAEIIMECTVETLTQAAAMALALSQQ
jgi:hypothetical protein